MTGTDEVRSDTNHLAPDLGEDLLLRRAQPSDIDAMVEFTAFVHGDSSMGISGGDLMRGLLPGTSHSDFVLVTGKQAPEQILAMGVLIHHTWAYEGIPFGVGNPELISTHPDHRRRGLATATINGLHAISEERWHLAQAVDGLRWFYRQFGYEYALSPGIRRQIDLADLPEPQAGQDYSCRRISEADIPHIARLYSAQCSDHLVTSIVSDSLRRRDILGYSPGAELGDWTYAVIDGAADFVGYFSTWGDPWGAFSVKELAAVPGVMLEQILPSILHFVSSMREVHAHAYSDGAPTKISFLLPTDHSVHRLLGDRLGPASSRTDWYMRVPDLPRFIRRVQPVLEQRLAASALAGFSGELLISFYGEGLRMRFDAGYLIEVLDWVPAGHAETFRSSAFPPLVFLKLLFGYRTLEELRFAYPDCWVHERDGELLSVLFPKLPSWLRQT